MKNAVLILYSFASLLTTDTVYAQGLAGMRFADLANFWKQNRFEDVQSVESCNLIIENAEHTNTVLKLRSSANDTSKCPAGVESRKVNDSEALICFQHLDSIFNKHFKENPTIDPEKLGCQETVWYNAQKPPPPPPESQYLSTSCTAIQVDYQTFRAVIVREKGQAPQTVCSGRYSCRQMSPSAPLIFGGHKLDSGKFQFRCAMPGSNSCEDVDLTNCQQIAYYEYGNIDALMNRGKAPADWTMSGSMTPVKQKTNDKGAKK